MKFIRVNRVDGVTGYRLSAIGYQLISDLAVYPMSPVKTLRVPGPLCRLAVFIPRSRENRRVPGRQQVACLRLVPGTRQAMLGQVRGERGEPACDLVMARQLELLHQCGAVESLVWMGDEEIEQPPRRSVADRGVGPRDVRLVD